MVNGILLAPKNVIEDDMSLGDENHSLMPRKYRHLTPQELQRYENSNSKEEINEYPLLPKAIREQQYGYPIKNKSAS